MKTNTYFFCITLISLHLLFSGCKKDKEIYEDGPTISWTKGVLTYSYSGGALSGVTANITFIVTEEKSGDIQITASLMGDEISSVSFVGPDQEYKVRVKCNISSQGEKGSIIIDSPGADEPFTVTNRDYKLVLNSITIE